MTGKVPTLHQDGPHAVTVTVGEVEIAFSYSTPVGFYSPATGWVISENLWGPTTGKHINALPGGSDKARRVARDDFDRLLSLAVSA